ncbi:MAG: hypothetical protein JXR83_05650 [Deltaproteobacteria bacterium]|nr:hypothetical protein [Deltaproteobacteria bacterium]
MGEQLPLPLTTPLAGQPEPNVEPVAGARSRRRWLQDKLAELCGEPVSVVVNDNRSNLLSAQRRGGTLAFRLHHMFLDADERVLRAAARFANRPDRSSRTLVDQFIERHGHLITRPPRPASARPARGRNHDLQAVFDELNRDYFAGRIDAEIVFGEAGRPQRRRRRRRSIKLGSYDDTARRIVIHPALDQPQVPRSFVAYIVFHEMLHQLYRPQRAGVALRFHGRDFKKAERAFAGRREAQRWFSRNLDLLLSYREPEVMAGDRPRRAP